MIGRFAGALFLLLGIILGGASGRFTGIGVFLKDKQQKPALAVSSATFFGSICALVLCGMHLDLAKLLVLALVAAIATAIFFLPCDWLMVRLAGSEDSRQNSSWRKAYFESYQEELAFAKSAGTFIGAVVGALTSMFATDYFTLQQGVLFIPLLVVVYSVLGFGFLPGVALLAFAIYRLFKGGLSWLDRLGERLFKRRP